MTTPADGSGSPLGGFEELLGEAEALRQRFEAGQDPSARHTAHDASGTVQVTVDGKGRVRKVDVDGRWKRVTGVDGLGPAVFEAATNAVMQRLAAWETAVAEADSTPGPTGATQRREVNASTSRPNAKEPPNATRERTVPAGPAPHDLEQALDALEDIDAELDKFQQRLARHLKRKAVGRSPGHHVTVSLAGGQISAIDIDPRWLRGNPQPYRLGEELRDAFRAAYKETGKASFEELLGDGPLGKLYATGSDPRRLLGPRSAESLGEADSPRRN